MTSRSKKAGKELYGDDLVKTPYWKVMERAKQTYAVGRMREAADLFLRCLIELAPTKWSNERYNIFLVYCDYLCQKDENVTDKDLKALEQSFVNNQDEPVLFRYKAALDLAFLRLSRNDIDGTVEMSRKAIELSRISSSLSERTKIVKGLRPDASGTSVICMVENLFADLEPKLSALQGMVRFHESIQRNSFTVATTLEQFRGKLETALLYPSKMGHLRYMNFAEYAFALGAEGFPVSQEKDVNILEEKFIQNEEEPMLFRCRAACALLQVKWNQGDYAAAEEYRKKALAFMRETSAEERATVVRALRLYLHPEGERPMDATVSDLYEDLMQLYLDEKGPKQDQITPAVNITQIEMQNICQRENMDMMAFARRMVQGGDDCDYCQKSKEELGVERFNACAKCLRASYCSKECQRKHWSAGHRTACRKPKDDIHPGDLMKLQNLQKKSLNHRVVKVVRTDPNTEGRWEVMFFDDATSNASVASEKLIHLRPMT